MATYYKPQSPIQSGEDFIYPITTADQVMVDGDTRLNAVGVYLENIDYSTDTTVYGNNATTLGGRAPGYYTNPRNLLDNSDFTNPVNQRGKTSYIGSDQGQYTIDRWKIWNEETLNVNDGYIEIIGRAYQYYPLNTFKNTVHTFAAKKFDGTIITTTFNPNQEPTQDIYGNLLGNDGWLTIIGLTNGQYVWAALYEGSYTAETLPPYVPKGYAVELAECMRYYHPNIVCAGLGINSDIVIIGKEINPPMRKRPSITFRYITDGFTLVDATNAAVRDNNYTDRSIQYIDNVGKITADKNYSIAFDAIADL